MNWERKVKKKNLLYAHHTVYALMNVILSVFFLLWESECQSDWKKCPLIDGECEKKKKLDSLMILNRFFVVIFLFLLISTRFFFSNRFFLWTCLKVIFKFSRKLQIAHTFLVRYLRFHSTHTHTLKTEIWSKKNRKPKIIVAKKIIRRI